MILTIVGWAFIVLLAINALLTVSQIGEPRNPITPGLAVTIIIINGLSVWLVLALLSR